MLPIARSFLRKPRAMTALLALSISISATAADGSAPGSPLILAVEARKFDRIDTPITFELDEESLPGPIRDALREGPTSGIFREGPDGPPVPVQIDRAPDAPEGLVRLTWILRGTTPAGSSRTFRLESPAAAVEGPWALSLKEGDALDLSHGGQPVFRYNIAPRSDPRHDPKYTREAYIHPAFTPSGKLITGDFSPFHPHHRGFFLAYTKTQWRDQQPDFWNFPAGSGKIVFDRLESRGVGAVAAQFVLHHRWEAKGEDVLKERWEVRAYAIPGQPYWLWDLTSTQQAVSDPLELVPYRYGGMAYRGPEPFVKAELDVLTSEGAGRRERDQKPARWVDLTGPVEEGSDRYGGAMIADHPDNPNQPAIARIHPVSLPFFCYVPGHDKPLTIGRDRPTVFRYRILIHDGRPDRALDERVWRDFAEPPDVFLVTTPPE